jgi:hypothetical protein
MIKPEHKHYFGKLEVGVKTDKGTVQDLYFLTWVGFSGAREEHEPSGKGILMAKVDGKKYAIGELTIQN